MKPAKDDFQVVNRELRVIGGDDAGAPPVIHMDSGPNMGIAWIKGQSFDQGTIEFEGKGKDVFQQSFVGIAFHGVDDRTYEAIYLRPFNFRAEDPDRKAHAVQYMAMPSHDWPRLRTEHPDQYEKPVVPAPDPAAWFHVKIEVTGDQIRVFINHNELPALEVKSLAQSRGDKIGYWVGKDSDGEWKNLSIR